MEKQQNQKSMCDSELVWPASLRYLLSGSSQKKKKFALESTVSVLEGSLSTVVYHGHSSALLDVKMKV